MTGDIDYLSDGNRVFAIGNGHEFLGQITGVCLKTFLTVYITVEQPNIWTILADDELIYRLAVPWGPSPAPSCPSTVPTNSTLFSLDY